ncbi:ATP-dependent RecD-like DNA helicase [bacterium]|nr:ATP-dependent RecD-like DNA helicase [bacterium]
MSDWRRRQKPPDVFQQLRSETEFKGTVARIVYASDDGLFQVARFRPENEEDLISITGALKGIAAGEPLHIHGEWKMHRQHGPTFEVASYVPIMPTNTEMMHAYLGSGLVKGIGKAYAKRIVDHFGEETLDILEHAPERLREVQGLGRKRAEAVGAAWESHRQTHEVMMFLQSHNISPALARRLFKHYGNEAASVLRTNPYRAGIEVSGIGFVTADQMASNIGIARDSPDRVRAGLVHLLSRASDEGHTYVTVEKLISDATELLAVDATLVEQVFADEAQRAQLIRRLALPEGQDAVFLQSLYLSESGAARLLNGLISTARPVVDPSHIGRRIDEFEERFRFGLAPMQRQAIHSVLEGGVSVITGGPGTGKTTLVRALLHVVRDENVRVALCSPTGRAAQRLSETTRHDACTIHRLLKFQPQTHRFQYGPDTPLEVDLLIVDESSMLDIPLGYHLLGALKPGATVVFVGDKDQLPSVGAGNFLGDLIESGRIRTTRLDTIFRQAKRSAIIVNSHRINEGQYPLIPRTDDQREKSDFFFVQRDDPMELRDVLIEVVTRRIPQKFNFNPVEDVQVLTPMRRGGLGTNELNQVLQQTLNPDSAPLNIGGMNLRVGDKVLQTRNNYDLEVFNGDVGRITSISRESMTLRILFGKRPVEYRWEEADQLSLAYAMTVHKSQGSEYPAVVMIVHTQHFIMLRRNLLYTGITRGKKLVILLGSHRALRMAVQNAQSDERLSALRQWLARPPERDGLF